MYSRLFITTLFYRWEKLKIVQKARDYTNLSRVLENEGRFSKAVEVFDEAGKRFEALEKAKKFEQEEFILEENFRSKELASKYVKIINSQKRRKNGSEFSVFRSSIELSNRIRNSLDVKKRG